LYDRHIKQSISQVNFNIFDKEENFFNRFAYYKTTYQTAYNAFTKKKIFGYGPKSFRYFCSEEGVAVIIPSARMEDNRILTFIVDRKYSGMRVIKLHVSKNDKISNNDLILSYEYKDNVYDFKSNREGKIKNLYIKSGDFIENHHILLDLDISATDLPIQKFYDVNGCTTHPHNFYLQLLTETGIIGTLFIFLNFIYLIIITIKFLYKKVSKNIVELNNTKICLIINFIIFLFPLFPNGNFFNNWLNMTILIQISFYLFIFNKDKLRYEGKK
jgi:hypothetical protein